MKNIFRIFLCVFMFATLIFTVRAAGGADWVAIPVEVSLDNPSDNILVSKYCGSQLECLADMELSYDNTTYTVRVYVRVVRDLLGVNPADRYTHELVLFYDQSMPDLPEFMKIRKNSWDLPKIRPSMTTDEKNRSLKQLEMIRSMNEPRKCSLTCHFCGGEDIVMRGGISFSYNYFENEGWRQSVISPTGLTCPTPATPQRVNWLQ